MLCLRILVRQTQCGESELWLISLFSWMVGKIQATVTFRWHWGQGRCRENRVVEHLPFRSTQVCYAEVVAACCISSMGINATLVFVS